MSPVGFEPTIPVIAKVLITLLKAVSGYYRRSLNVSISVLTTLRANRVLFAPYYVHSLTGPVVFFLNIWYAPRLSETAYSARKVSLIFSTNFVRKLSHFMKYLAKHCHQHCNVFV
jgi:hypothetical protein